MTSIIQTEVDDQSHKHKWTESILKIAHESGDAVTPRGPRRTIPKVSPILRKQKDSERYYEPLVVSLGPYHHGKSQFKFIEDLKPKITKMFVDNKQKLEELYDTLYKEIKAVRKCYEEDECTQRISDGEFTSMMLQDGCFILFYINDSVNDIYSKSNKLGLKNEHIAFIDRDMFLLENQIPFLVLKKIMISTNLFLEEDNISWFVDANSFTNQWFVKKKGMCKNMDVYADHLLGLMQKRLARVHPDTQSETTKCFPKGLMQKRLAREHLDTLSETIQKRLVREYPQTLSENIQMSFAREHPDTQSETTKCFPKSFGKCFSHPPKKNTFSKTKNGYTFRNVNELLKVGIRLRPSKSNCLADIHYRPSLSGFFAYLELPRITVRDYTRPIVLNLVAYETIENVFREANLVTSYICFLDSLIDDADDVKVLRKAGVLNNFLGSDEEVARLFNEIGTDLFLDPYTYGDVKWKIQEHYENKGKTWMAELRFDYFKNPWSFIAFVGAVLVLFLTSVQTYYNVWPKSECDSLCKSLKLNHHL